MSRLLGGYLGGSSIFPKRAAYSETVVKPKRRKKRKAKPQDSEESNREAELAAEQLRQRIRATPGDYGTQAIKRARERTALVKRMAGLSKPKPVK